MKKVRVFLSVVAFMIALGGVLTSQGFGSTSVDGYRMIAGECTFISNICDTNGTYACKVNSAPTTPVLHEFLNDTQCGEELFRLDPPPAP